MTLSLRVKIASVYKFRKLEWEKLHKKRINSRNAWRVHEEATQACVSRHGTLRKCRAGVPDSTTYRARLASLTHTHKCCRSSRERFTYATLGDGVDIRRSTLIGVTVKNRGLFACRTFYTNELITEYTGPQITRDEALKLKREGRASHVRKLNYDSCIDGDKCPIKGQGVAQFANDASPEGRNNAHFEIKFDPTTATLRCFLKAARVIQADEEIFVCYGSNYWIINRSTGEKMYTEQVHEKRVHNESVRS